MSFRRPAFTEWWQRIANTYSIRANVSLAGREYGKYGTIFGMQILVIDKTGATPGDTWQEQLEAILWGEAECLEAAWNAVKELAPLYVAGDEQSSVEVDNESTSLLVPYQPVRLKGGRPHPAMFVESASMAAVLPPVITYRPHLALEIVSQGLPAAWA